jgi:hypothetical protein
LIDDHWSAWTHGFRENTSRMFRQTLRLERKEELQVEDLELRESTLFKPASEKSV